MRIILVPSLGPEPGPGAPIIVGVRGVWLKYLNYILGPFTNFQTSVFSLITQERPSQSREGPDHPQPLALGLLINETKARLHSGPS